jgi:hypothetical protein
MSKSRDAVEDIRTIDTVTATANAALPKAGGALTGTVTNFTSTGIDDNATSTAVTIDASENVGIGVVPEAWHSVWSATRIGDGASLTGRSDVSSAELGSNFYINATADSKAIDTSGASSHYMYNGAHYFYVDPPSSAGRTISWNTGFEVLNDGKARAKNGLLFGTDTAAANTLSDYETGSWTPSFVSVNSTTPTGNMAHAGSYTKIGRTVSICCYMQVTSGLSVGGGTLAIAGLPFSSIDAGGHRATGALLASTWDPARTENIGVGIYDATRLGFLTSNHDSAWNWEQTGSLNNQTNMRFSMTYFTNS